MAEKLLELPIGTQDFKKLRLENKLYVDKTEKLLELITQNSNVFLSRPRRFGKSLTLSTLEAMFSGEWALFDGLYFGEWLKSNEFKPSPVLYLDMGGMISRSEETLKESLCEELESFATRKKLTIRKGHPGNMLRRIAQNIYDAEGPMVLLIDEYDKPILDNIGEPERLEPIRSFMQSFYSVVKSCDRYLRFLMLTGISKFSRLSVFSAMNNLNDISMDEQWGGIVGYTQEELENNFSGWIDAAAAKLTLERSDYLSLLKAYYDGFCFDGKTKLYNPFSVMQSLQKVRLGEFWYDSGTPSFIAAYLKRQAVKSVDEYRHLQVGDDFTSAREIYAAPPESFLYQAGYLTMEKYEGRIVTLDYPNKEVLSAISRTFLDSIYGIEGALLPGIEMLQALHDGNVDGCMEKLNSILSGVASDLFRDKHESTYSALFTALLRGAGADCESEANSAHGRCDLKVRLRQKIYVIEFKLARQIGSAERLLQEGKEQIGVKGYMEPHADDTREIIPLTVIFDAESHKAVLWG